MSDTTEVWVPIFLKNDNEFFVTHKDYRGESEDEAREIGLGTMLVECIIYGFSFARVTKLDPDMPARKAKLGHLPVAIISGPLFDETH